jgi:hypothetical protein
LRELVSRSIYLCWNADYQFRSLLIGEPQPLYPGEIKLAGAINVKTTAAERTWEYWSARLKASAFWPPQQQPKAVRRLAAKPARKPGRTKSARAVGRTKRRR